MEEMMKERYDSILENVKETFGTVKAKTDNIKMYRRILNDLEEDRDIVDIIASYLPGITHDTLQRDTNELYKGVQAMYDRKDLDTFEESVKMQMRKNLAELSMEERMTCLYNVAVVYQTAYPDEVISDEMKDAMEDLGKDQKADQKTVEMMMDAVCNMIDHHAGVMTRYSVQAMEHFLPYMEEDEVRDQLNQSENEALAYAISTYILQKMNDKLVVDRQYVAHMSAYSIGIHAATEIENCKLMHAYKKGHITKYELQKKMKVLWSNMITFSINNLIRGLAFFTQYKIAKFTFQQVSQYLLIYTGLAPSLIICFAGAAAITLGFIVVDNEELTDELTKMWEDSKKVIEGFLERLNVLLSRITGKTEQDLSEVAEMKDEEELSELADNMNYEDIQETDKA